MKLVGIDIGGTKILIALIDENGILKRKVRMVMSDGNYRKILEKIITEIKKMQGFGWVSTHPSKPVGSPRLQSGVNEVNKLHNNVAPDFSRGEKSGNISSVGISIAGDVDGKNGILRYSPNLPKWRNVKLKQYFEKKLNVPTVVDNDANCAAYGSYIVDGRNKYKNFITVTLGTGVGGGIIIDGKLYRGSTGSAGEIGHITINPDGPKCNCGNRGCLEAYIGTKGIIKTATKLGFKNITPAIIAYKARKGNKQAIRVYKKFSEYLSVGIGSLINIFNPDMITFSGGVSNNWDLIEKRFFDELKKRAFKTPLEHVKIIKSKNPENLGAIGAALLSKK